MKARLVSNLNAVKVFKEVGIKSEGTVMLRSVIEGEAAGREGTLACFLEGYTADRMIATEPFTYVCNCRPGGPLPPYEDEGKERAQSGFFSLRNDQSGPVI